jgi:hypothetical protein
MGALWRRSTTRVVEACSRTRLKQFNPLISPRSLNICIRLNGLLGIDLKYFVRRAAIDGPITDCCGTPSACRTSVALLLIVTLLVILFAAGAWFSETSFWQHASLKPAFRIGAPVVYRQQEVSTHPAADARDVYPAERGEYYYYTVINYLRVAEVMADGRIIAVARNNKRLCFRPNDSGLRKARLAERLIYRPRFPRFGDNSSASR